MPYYAVAVGRKPGIYHTWEECWEQTNGFRNSKFKKFDRESEATIYIRENSVISESVPVNSPMKLNSNPIAYSPMKLNSNPIAYSPMKPNSNPIAYSPMKPHSNPIAYSPMKPNSNPIAYSPMKPHSNPIAYSPMKLNSNPIAYSPMKPNSNPIAYSPVKPNSRPIAYSPMKPNSNPIAYSPMKPHINPIAYYAVAVGHKPGIYHTWIECQKATEGFSRPKYRKFATHEEAKSFMESNHNSGGDSNAVQLNMPKAFYAVAIGRQRGIYETWAQCKVQVEDFVGPVYRKFDNREAAQKFIDENSPTKRKALPSFRGESFSKRVKRTDLEITSDGSIVAYTDGACVNNGKKHCAAGIGVFWANNHPDNISQPLDGRPTNNRAEIHAAITAIRQAKKNGHLRIIIRTDSQFLINSATKWIDGWRKNGWKLSTGEPVINKQDFLELIDVMHGMERVTWEKVAAHKGIYGNEMADKLARDGVRRMEKKR